MTKRHTQTQLDALKRHQITFKDDPSRINRNGRPSTISDALKQFTGMKSISYNIEMTDSNGRVQRKTGKLATGDKKTLRELIAVNLLQKAISGDLKAAEIIMDRTEGKPIQTINTDSQNIANIIINRTVITNEPESQFDVQPGSGLDFLSEQGEI